MLMLEGDPHDWTEIHCHECEDFYRTIPTVIPSSTPLLVLTCPRCALILTVLRERPKN